MGFAIEDGDTLETVIDRLAATVEEVRASASEDFPLPPPELVRSLLREITTDKGKRGIRCLRSPRKGASEEARCLFSCLGWHNSGGSLWSPMLWTMLIGAEKWNEIDNLALVLRKGKSHALAQWDKALDGR